jgi:hypothetical protein
MKRTDKAISTHNADAGINQIEYVKGLKIYQNAGRCDIAITCAIHDVARRSAEYNDSRDVASRTQRHIRLPRQCNNGPVNATSALRSPSLSAVRSSSKRRDFRHSAGQKNEMM